MKKLLSLVLAVALLATMSMAAVAESDKELTVWYSGGVNGKAIRKAAELYTAANPDVTINIEEVATSDRETRLTVALSSSVPSSSSGLKPQRGSEKFIIKGYIFSVAVLAVFSDT